jgi:hypothetical protein
VNRAACESRRRRPLTESFGANAFACVDGAGALRNRRTRLQAAGAGSIEPKYRLPALRRRGANNGWTWIWQESWRANKRHDQL